MTDPAATVSDRRRRAGANRARTGRWLLRLVLRPLLAVLVLGVLAAFGLALRLAAGPVEVTWLVHAVTPLPLGHGAGEDPLGRLEVGRAWIGWNGLRSGPDAPLVARLQDLTIRRSDGVVLDHVDTARIGLATGPLLAGDISIEEVAITGARLNLSRTPDGAFDLGLSAPGRTGVRGSSGPMLRWDRLRQVDVADMQVRVHDLMLGRDWSLRDVAFQNRPAGPSGAAGSGIVGRFAATLDIAHRHAVLHGEGAPSDDGRPGDVGWRIAVDALVPATLAGVLPQLAPLQALALPVAPVLQVTFANGPGRFMEPMHGTLSASLGQGTVQAAGASLAIASGLIRLRADLPDGPRQTVALQLQQADLQLRDAADRPGAPPTGPLLHAHGSLDLDSLDAPARIRATLAADIPRIGFAGLAQYWPKGAAAGARRWITANITDGTATGLHVETRLASDHGWSALAETARTGGFDATGLTLWWLRPIAPLHDMQARLTFQGPDAVLIQTPHALMPVEIPGPGSGRVHTILVTNGAMRITGLDASQQIGAIDVRLTGDLGDLLVELAHPRLKLLSRHPVSFTAPSGETVTDVHVELPLDDDVAIEQLKVAATSRMRHIHLGDVAAGRALNDAALAVTAGIDGLTLDGHGLVGSIPAKLHYAMDFRAGPPDQVTEQAHVQADITTAALAREGLDPSDNVAGDGALSVDYADHRSGEAQVSLGLDLTGLAIDTQVWSKRRGEPAHAQATIALLHGHLVSIDRIDATGPGLAVQAHAAISGGRAHRIVVGHFTVGRTSGVGRIDLPGAAARGAAPEPIHVSAHGPALDLSAAMDTPKEPAPRRAGRRPAKPATPQPWVADLAFDRVFVGRQASLTGLSAHVEDDGRHLSLARLDAAGPTPVSVRMTSDQGGRLLHAAAGDTGLLLQQLGVTGALSGGALALDGRLDDRAAAAPLSGTVTLGRLVVRDAPLAARIVRNLSIYGWLTALPAPQLAIDRTVLPFTLQHQVLTLSDARAHSAALGVTLRGSVDLGRQTLDLKGTVVPVWAVNQLPGRLPVLGRLLSPEKGGGVLAATLTLQGPFAAPDVHVNALSALAPGFLRRLLFE